MTSADHFSILLYAFKTTEGFNLQQFLNDPDNRWKITHTAPDNSFLFEHVHRFLSGNTGVKPEQVNPDACIVMQLDLAHSNRVLHDKLFSKQHEVFLKNGQTVQFNFGLKESTFSPLLIYVPLARIGIITLGVKLKDAAAEADTLLSFLHELRIHRKGQLLPIYTPKNQNEKAENENIKIAEQLINYINEEEIADKPGYFGWNLPAYFSYLMGNAAAHTETISPPRLQAMNYFCTQNLVPDLQVLKHFIFRLTRVYTANYQPPNDMAAIQKHFIQPFEPIHYASFQEGSSIVINTDSQQSNGILEKYGNQVVLPRLYWSWLLANIQHYALINAASLVAATYHTQSTAPESISGLVRQLFNIQIKCIFTQISHHTQQNDFYALCCKALHIKELFEEMKTEITDLNVYLEDETRKKEQWVKELEKKDDDDRSDRLNTTIGAIGIGISAAQISAGLEPNFLMNIFEADFKHLKEVLSVATYGLIEETIILSTNLALGIIVGLFGRMLLSAYFKKRKKENALADVL